MKDNIRDSMKIQLFIVAWFIFTSQLVFFSITRYSAVIKLIVLVCIPAFSILNSGKSRIRHTDWLWVSAIIMFGFQAVISTNISGGIFAVLKLIVFYILFVFLSRSYGWQEKCNKLLILFSGIHVACTVLQYFKPNILNILNSKILSVESYSKTLELYSYGSYAGIAEQTSFNAMFIVIFIVGLSSRILIFRKNRIQNVILLIIGFAALFLTAKRGAVVAVLFAAVIGVFLSLIKSKKNFRKLITISVVALIVYFLTVSIPSLYYVFQRFGGSDNFMTNRNVIFSFMLKGIKESPILGKGTGSLSTSLSLSGHNIYLQILYENGIVGLIIMLSIFANALKHTGKMLKNIRNSEQTNEKIKAIFLASYMFQIYFLINGLTESVFYNPTMFAPYIVMIAMTYSVFYNNEKS